MPRSSTSRPSAASADLRDHASPAGRTASASRSARVHAFVEQRAAADSARSHVPALAKVRSAGRRNGRAGRATSVIRPSSPPSTASRSRCVTGSKRLGKLCMKNEARSLDRCARCARSRRDSCRAASRTGPRAARRARARPASAWRDGLAADRHRVAARRATRRATSDTRAEARRRLATARGIVVPDAGQHAALARTPRSRSSRGSARTTARRRATATPASSSAFRSSSRHAIGGRRAVRCVVERIDRLDDPHAAQCVALRCRSRGALACDAGEPRRVLALPERRLRQRGTCQSRPKRSGTNARKRPALGAQPQRALARRRSPSGSGRSRRPRSSTSRA